MEWNLCKLPTAIVSSLAVINNIAMIVAIHYTKKLKGPMRRLVTNLGCIDCLLSLTISCRSFANLRSIRHTEWTSTSRAIVLSVGIAMSLVQTLSQVTIALERLFAISNPLSYRMVHSKTSRFLVFTAVWLGSAVLATILGSTSIIFDRPEVVSIGTLILFSLNTITLAIVYLLIFIYLRRSRNQVALSTSDGKAACHGNLINYKDQQKRLHILASGITITFFLCTCPFMVFVSMYSVEMQSEPCATQKGIFYTISLCFLCINMLFDPLWYFYVNYRMTRQKKISSAQTPGNAATSKQVQLCQEKE